MAGVGLGSYLQSVGINPSILLCSDLSALTALKLRVTNGLVLDLHWFMNRTEKCTYHTFKNWLAALFGESWPGDHLPTVKALRQSVISLSSRLSKFKKERNSKVKEAFISSFLDEEYCLPRIFVSQGKIIRRVSSSSSTTSNDWEKEALELANKRLCEELSELSLKTSELKHEEQKLKKSQQKMYCKRRNDLKKLRRREKELQLKKKVIVDGKNQIHELQKDLSDRESGIEEMKKNIDRLRHRAVYWKAKCDDLKSSSGEEVTDAIIKEQKVQKKLMDEVDALEQENLELQDVVDELMASNEDITFEKGRYTDSIRSCCYELLSLNVGIRNIRPVIKSVFSNIAKRSVDRLPSKTTLCDMMVECLTAAQSQLGEQLTCAGKDYFTLHTDGTTKYGEHFGTYDVTTEDKTYHLGLRHVFSGSAQTTRHFS